jgi:hypothetical protein
VGADAVSNAEGNIKGADRAMALAKLRKVPKQFSWDDQRLVREYYMDALSHPACALYLFLLTVANAQGLSYCSEPALCRRLSMSEATLHQTRQELIARQLVAYHGCFLGGTVLDFTENERWRGDAGIH